MWLQVKNEYEICEIKHRTSDTNMRWKGDKKIVTCIYYQNALLIRDFLNVVCEMLSYVEQTSQAKFVHLGHNKMNTYIKRGLSLTGDNECLKHYSLWIVMISL